MTAVIESYIVIDANSVAWLADTRTKVLSHLKQTTGKHAYQ